MPKILLAHWNYDYDESLSVHPDTEEGRQELLQDIIGSFGLEADLKPGETMPPFGSDELWMLVTYAYESGDWKGFKVYQLDTETLQIKDLY